MSAPRLYRKGNGVKKLVALSKRLNGPFAKAGFLAANASRGGTGHGAQAEISNPELARILNYGSRTIPARSFMSGPLKSNRKSYRRALARLGGRVLKGKADLREGLEVIAQRVERDIRRSMRSVGIPDAASTLEGKSGTTPLIDTRQLINSVSSEVVG